MIIHDLHDHTYIYMLPTCYRLLQCLSMLGWPRRRCTQRRGQNHRFSHHRGRRLQQPPHGDEKLNAIKRNQFGATQKYKHYLTYLTFWTSFLVSMDAELVALHFRLSRPVETLFLVADLHLGESCLQFCRPVKVDKSELPHQKKTVCAFAIMIRGPITLIPAKCFALEIAEYGEILKRAQTPPKCSLSVYTTLHGTDSIQAWFIRIWSDAQNKRLSVDNYDYNFHYSWWHLNI